MLLHGLGGWCSVQEKADCDEFLDQRQDGVDTLREGKKAMFRGCGGAKSRVGKTTVTDERTSTESMIMPDDGFLSMKSYKSVLHIHIQAGGEECPWSALRVGMPRFLSSHFVLQVLPAGLNNRFGDMAHVDSTPSACCKVQ